MDVDKKPEAAAAAAADSTSAKPAAATAAANSAPVISSDSLYRCDIGERDAIFAKVKKGLRDDVLDQRHVTKVKLSGLAATKILMHAKQGVDAGVAANGFPLEVMGLLFGASTLRFPPLRSAPSAPRPPTDHPRGPPSLAAGYPMDDGKTVVVTDAFEVPAAGGAHAVEMDPETSVYMAELMESLRQTRPEGKICGWFHSHPFDANALDETLGKDDHCWFSQIDVSNQLSWQQAFETMDGVPFVGIVVDPKTSCQKRRLVMRAFRNYSKMAAYDPGTIMPDGRAEPYENYAFERWGAGWKSYYEIKLEYFNSMMGNLIMDSLGGSLWVDELASSPTNERQFTVSAPGRIREIATDISKAAPRVGGSRGGGMSMAYSGAAGGGGGGGGGGSSSESGPTDPASLLAKAAKSSSKLTSEIAAGAARTICKQQLFGSLAAAGSVDMHP
jgi:proteasome lid subunit RPN8/RPN11|eukprot:COSAG06_NODE_7310_length_2550_cov_2.690330_2_plen_444_part_00